MGEELEEEEAISTNTSQEELDRHDDSGRLLDENITEEDYEDEEDMEDGEVDHRITVIQIEGQDKENKKDTHGTGSESNYSERSSSPPIGNNGSNFLPSADGKLLDQNHNSNTLPLVRTTRRELPRIVTNGTLGRPSSMNSHQSYPTKNRRLPDRSHFQTSNNHHPAQEPPPTPQLQNVPSSSRYFQPQQRIYRSNLPRPAPIHHFGPAGRVPLPPVPELERSDHERESMSPTPSSVPSPRSSTSASASGFGGSGNPIGGGVSNNNNSHAYRPLPSPLSTPVQPSTISSRVQAKPRRGLLRNPADHHNQQKNSSPSRIPRATSSSERDFSPSSSQRFHSQQLPPMPTSKADLETKGKVVDERLRVLLSLLESGKENATDHGREDTLQYLSQLESVARRLKDQLLQDATPTSAPRHGSQVQ